MPKAPRGFQSMSELHLRQLARLAERGAVTRLRRLYDQAQKDLERKIRQLSGPAANQFTAAQMATTLAQIQQGQAEIARQLAGALGEASRETQVDALRQLIRRVKQMEKKFTGIAAPVPIEEAARFAGIIDRNRASLLSMHETSMGRYGARVVEKMQGELAQSLIQGESNADAIDRIRKTADLEWWQAERVVRCLPESVTVTGAVVRAATRRPHQGAMVKVIAEGGRDLTATPNHPVLTRRGWVPLGSVVKGDYLIRYHGNQDPGFPGNKNVTRRPAKIDQVFDAISAVGVTERRLGTEPDFHGDGLESDVDIASADSELMYGVFAPLAKPASEQLFSPSDVSAASFCPQCEHLVPYERPCLCAGSYFDTGFSKPSVYGRAGYAVSLGDFWCTIARLVRLDDLCIRKACSAGIGTMGIFDPLGFGVGSRDASSPHMLQNTSFANTNHLGDRRAAKARDVKLDRVLDLVFTEFSGHVYNLTTADGYFSCNGYYVGNTEQAWAYSSTQAAAVAESKADIPDLMLRWTEHVQDKSYAKMDDRVGDDSIAMHGQVAEPGGAFVMPPTTPDGKAVHASLVGRRWNHPPNRPNDRSVIQPWRPHWGVPGWIWQGGRRVYLHKR